MMSQSRVFKNIKMPEEKRDMNFKRHIKLF